MVLPEWLKSRRLWGAISVGIFAAIQFAFPDSKTVLEAIIQFVALVFGLSLPVWSYTVPSTGKKK